MCHPCVPTRMHVCELSTPLTPSLFLYVNDDGDGPHKKGVSSGPTTKKQ